MKDQYHHISHQLPLLQTEKKSSWNIHSMGMVKTWRGSKLKPLHVSPKIILLPLVFVWNHGNFSLPATIAQGSKAPGHSMPHVGDAQLNLRWGKEIFAIKKRLQRKKGAQFWTCWCWLFWIFLRLYLRFDWRFWFEGFFPQILRPENLPPQVFFKGVF